MVGGAGRGQIGPPRGEAQSEYRRRSSRLSTREVFTSLLAACYSWRASCCPVEWESARAWPGRQPAARSCVATALLPTCRASAFTSHFTALHEAGARRASNWSRHYCPKSSASRSSQRVHHHTDTVSPCRPITPVGVTRGLLTNKCSRRDHFVKASADLFLFYCLSGAGWT